MPKPVKFCVKIRWSYQKMKTRNCGAKIVSIFISYKPSFSLINQAHDPKMVFFKKQTLSRRAFLGTTAFISSGLLWNPTWGRSKYQGNNLPVTFPHFPSRLHAFIWRDRKSTRLNSSHVKISYAVFCLKKKN